MHCFIIGYLPFLMYSAIIALIRKEWKKILDLESATGCILIPEVFKGKDE